MIGESTGAVGRTRRSMSAIGVVRLTDTLARLHALAKASTLGVLLVLLGAAANLRNLNDLTSVVLAAMPFVLASPPAPTCSAGRQTSPRHRSDAGARADSRRVGARFSPAGRGVLARSAPETSDGG